MIDVLEGATSLEQVGGRASDQQNGRLGHLGVLDGRDGVGESGPGGDGGHADGAGEAGDGVGREHGAHLVARVHHSDAELLRGAQNGRDVAARQREDVLDVVGFQGGRD